MLDFSAKVLTAEHLDRAKPRIMLSFQLKDWMLAHGLTRKEVAKACRVDRRTVYRWLMDYNNIPRTVWPSLAQQFGEPLPPFETPRIDRRGKEYVVSETREGLPVYDLWPHDDEHTPAGWDDDQ